MRMRRISKRAIAIWFHHRVLVLKIGRPYVSLLTRTAVRDELIRRGYARDVLEIERKQALEGRIQEEQHYGE